MTSCNLLSDTFKLLYLSDNTMRRIRLSKRITKNDKIYIYVKYTNFYGKGEQN